MAWVLPWKHIVSEYSGRNLTKSSDKVLALQGVADALSQCQEHSVYSYSLYLASITRGLLWYVPSEPLRKPLTERGKATSSRI